MEREMGRGLSPEEAVAETPAPEVAPAEEQEKPERLNPEQVKECVALIKERGAANYARAFDIISETGSWHEGLAAEYPELHATVMESMRADLAEAKVRDLNFLNLATRMDWRLKEADAEWQEAAVSGVRQLITAGRREELKKLGNGMPFVEWAAAADVGIRDRLEGMI